MKKQPIKNVAGQVLPEGVKQTKLTNYWPGGHHAAQQDYRQMLAGKCANAMWAVTILS